MRKRDEFKNRMHTYYKDHTSYCSYLLQVSAPYAVCVYYTHDKILQIFLKMNYFKNIFIIITYDIYLHIKRINS